ncbi:hypothetical protein JQ557_33760 [Bradyrhizobium sp. U87765 SZCCT0131]|uniref:hypothetical protein n=1 Tax=unclassified Bradyrhizobium TaxID=2631580 RepID=UPI001BA4F390|nr:MULTISPECIES: hypothetical protein [unclassified Bradyrhizobium]MBR1223007.1 hypothetical protein [Bradyrhizobium sp. U87765 SZCCT0131]MBR1262743.1 hypothetical protein [Bradyrhizobium sp. U87765 SZCCT0134]MBR1308785.1 hypothetical protein [Bradyrhizobium sp. U87765 SZCCT0110]MBR1318525.1 hypothetical protein [Bradyrhizobium sp. U87765 SZCCT0109]MBR1352229.1 hypothetical protein [Bradyrhizobium sp. U87765 SZCCT0048]
MSNADVPDHAPAAEVEPLLLVEKQLIGWSLGIGLVLLVVLVVLNHVVPLK